MATDFPLVIVVGPCFGYVTMFILLIHQLNDDFHDVR